MSFTITEAGILDFHIVLSILLVLLILAAAWKYPIEHIPITELIFVNGSKLTVLIALGYFYLGKTFIFPAYDLFMLKDYVGMLKPISGALCSTVILMYAIFFMVEDLK